MGLRRASGWTALVLVVSTVLVPGSADAAPGEPSTGAAAATSQPATTTGATTGRTSGTTTADPGQPDPEPLDRSGFDDAPATQPVATGSGERVLVRFEDGVGAGEQRAALTEAGGTRDGAVGGTGFVEADGPDVAALAQTLAADPRVAEVQVDHERAVAGWSDDPYLPYAYPYLDLVGAAEAWDVTTGSGTTIAVIDTGVQGAHEDLRGKVLPGRDVVNGDDDATDDHGHGTLVAGIAAAAGDNGRGAAGIAPGASVLPVKVLDGSGHGSDSDVATGIVWAADHGADVLNLSLSGPDPSPVLRSALEYAVGTGAVVVIAAGNSGTEAPGYPAAYAADVPGVLSVSSTDDGGAILDSSSWGDSVSLSAPGSDIIGPSWAAPGSYLSATGTSMAAPFVAGAAALLRAQEPGLGAVAVAARLRSTARDAGPRGLDPYYGSGVVDVAAALGLTAQVPLDREISDVAGGDDLPGSARRAALGTRYTGSLGAEGDTDWYEFVPPSPGTYTVSLPSAIDGTAFATATVLDGQGRVLADQTAWAEFEVADTSPVQVGVGAAGRAFGSTYALVVQRSSTQVGPGTGTVRFGSERDIGAWAPGYGLRLVDVTGDGVQDAVTSSVVAVAGGAWRAAIHVSVQGAAGAWTDAGSVVVSGDLLAVPYDVADVDGDGLPEIVAGGTDGLHVLDASVGAPREVAFVALPAAASAVTAADADGDGLADVVVSTSSGLVVLWGDAAGVLVPVAVGAASSARIGVTDVDRDGRADLLLTGGRVMHQSAVRTFVDGAPVPGLATVTAFAVQDVDGDGLTDVVGISGSTPVLAFAEVGGGYGTPVLLSSVPSTSVPVIEDLDGDGLRDVLVGQGDYRYWVQTSPRTFRAAQYVGVSGGWEAAVGDLTGDGRPDLATSSSTRLMVRPQVDAVLPPGGPAWTWSVSPSAYQRGVQVRPTVEIVTRRALASASITDGTVRVLDAITGEQVGGTLGWDPAARSITFVPGVDLVAGHTYQVRVAGLQDVDGDVQATVTRTWFTVGAGGDRFTPVEPTRVLDTRTTGSRLSPGSSIGVGLAGFVPAGASAVVLNVTAVSPSARGNVRVYPDVPGGVPPTVSNLNLVPGVDQPNLVTVKLGPGRGVRLAIEGLSADLVVDVAGYYAEGGATGYVPVTPVRVMDLRDGTGAPVLSRSDARRRLVAGSWVDLVVVGRHGVPTDATAVVLNVTGVQPTGRTNVRVYPRPADSASQQPPLVSNLNLEPGRDQPNLVTVPVGADGSVRFYTQSAALWLVADLAGYYSPTGTEGFVAIEPTRVADTRRASGISSALAAGQEARLPVAGAGVVPATASAVVLNVTAVAPLAPTNVRVFPTTSGGAVPLVSNLNVQRGRDEPNLAIVPVGDGGQVSFYAQSAGMHLVVDVAGYFSRWSSGPR